MDDQLAKELISPEGAKQNKGKSLKESTSCSEIKVWQIFLCSCVVTFLANVGAAAFSPFIPLVFNNRGFTNDGLAALIGIYSATYAVSTLFMDKAVKLLKRRKLLTLSVVSFGLSMGLISLALSLDISENSLYWLLFLGRAWQGLSVG